MNSGKTKIHLKDFRLAELQKLLVDLGESKFRGKQIFNWMYENFIDNFEEMANLPISLREKLDDLSEINTIKLISSQRSDSTKTVKYLFETNDGKKIESVIIPDGGILLGYITSNVPKPEWMPVSISFQADKS